MILAGRIGMGMEVLAAPSRAPRRGGRVWLLRRSPPVSQMLPLQLREETEGQASAVGFLTLPCPLPPTPQQGA